ncbi:alpha/beta hydrolase family protein [Roseateles puraquae]|uniref:alpha/beta hydrolase family protein n=1 Tax=Roseateles puraquae TaxID=431059 RepID=UPI0031DA7D4C
MSTLPAWTWALLAWALLMGLLVLAQGRLLFGHTWRIRRTQPGPAAHRRGTRAVRLERPGGVRLKGWLTLPTGHAPRRLLLWFGGRNEHVAWTPDLAGWLPDDCALLAFNYRGLGGSTGWPGEAACVDDAEAIAAWGLAELGLPPAALHLAGRSLGTGVAMQLAAQRARAGSPVAGVVLITPLKSLRALLLRNPWTAPLTPWLRSPLDSLAAARGLRCGVLVLLAETDRQVPHAHSHALVHALRQAGAAVSVHQVAGTNHHSLARTPQAMGCLGRWLAPRSSA